MTALLEGQLAPTFSLPDLAGHAHELDRTPMPTLLVFFKKSCGTSRFVLPYLQKLCQSYPPGAWQLWAISQDDAETARALAIENHLTLPILLDTDWHVSKQYQLQYVPTFIWLQPDRHILSISTYFHKQDLNVLNARIAALTHAAPIQLFDPGDGVPDYRPG